MLYSRLYPACASEKLPPWECPNFVFTLLGLLTIGIMIGTYLVARFYVTIEFLAMLMIISAMVLLILNYLVSQGVERMSQAKKVAEYEKSKTEAVIRHLCDGLVMLNNNCQVVMVNPLAAKLLGVSEASVLGLDVRQPTRSASLEPFFTTLHWCPSLGHRLKNEIYQEEITLLRPRPQVLQVQTTTVQDPLGRPLGFIKVLHDVTREKQLDEIKSDFISIASHQLKTPLSTMKWNLELLAKYSPPQSQNLLAKTAEANEEMIQIVRDLLDVSRIEQGRLKPQLESGALSEVVESVAGKFKLLAEKKNISFTVELPPHRIKQLIDPSAMAMVLNNLIDNALRYTPGHGRVSVKLSYEPLDQPKQAVIIVADSGVGIPRSEQARLFTKFFRANNVGTISPKGTGLGLYIAKNIVERHHGHLHVKSELDHGSTFSVILPLRYPT